MICFLLSGVQCIDMPRYCRTRNVQFTGYCYSTAQMLQCTGYHAILELETCSFSRYLAIVCGARNIQFVAFIVILELKACSVGYHVILELEIWYTGYRALQSSKCVVYWIPRIVELEMCTLLDTTHSRARNEQYIGYHVIMEFEMCSLLNTTLLQYSKFVVSQISCYSRVRNVQCTGYDVILELEMCSLLNTTLLQSSKFVVSYIPCYSRFRNV